MSPLRNYRNIYNLDKSSPAKMMFAELELKQQVDPEKEYLVDIKKVGSPKKKGILKKKKENEPIIKPKSTITTHNQSTSNDVSHNPRDYNEQY